LPRTGCLGPLVTGPANRSDILLPTTHAQRFELAEGVFDSPHRIWHIIFLSRRSPRVWRGITGDLSLCAAKVTATKDPYISQLSQQSSAHKSTQESITG
jgi:hypothetical protein